LAKGWVEAGAAAVGGCCRVGPSEIAAVAQVLRGGPAAGGTAGVMRPDDQTS
jgi:homocysteine S-methyltransferase